MEKISLKERFSYGLGDLACNLMFQLITAYLMFFYTDVAGWLPEWWTRSRTR